MTAFATGCQGSMKKSPSAQKRPEGERVIRSGVTSNSRKSKLLGLAQVDRMLCYATAVLANEFRIPDQPFVLFKILLYIAYILQKAQVLLMLGMGHFKAGNFDNVRHREISFIKK
jgi:hypothetical protein